MRQRPTTWLDDNFKLLEDAAIAGERCPQNDPHGPLATGAIPALIAAKRVRSEVYAHNYRVITILVGPHKGKKTAPAPLGAAPYRINGVRVDLLRGRSVGR